MKMAAAIGASILVLVLGNPALVSAQHDHKDERGSSDKRHGNEHEKEHGRSSAQHFDKHQAHQREERREQHSARRDAWQDHRAQHWEQEHHTWHERGGYRGYRIPQDRFRANFGRGHWFRVHSAPILVVGGYPRFQYGGFWFSVVDPWPEYWSDDWYDNDDVYIEYYGDGYYLYNRRFPQDRIAISVSVN